MIEDDLDNKWVVLRDYEQILDRLRKRRLAGDINQAARMSVVAELRKLADHIESNRSPYLYAYDVRQFNRTVTESRICLSGPWGG